jgi:predicted NBD/HSP70 family sugar kinase
MSTARRGTVLDLRRGNRSALLRALYFDAPTSRQSLGAATGLSPASVSNVVNELIDAGIVVEAGAVNSDGGRPRTLIEINREYAHVIGIDIGETRVRVELFDLTLGQAIASVDGPLESGHHDVDVVVAATTESLQNLLTTTGCTYKSVIGIGISVPGVVEQGDVVLVHGQSFDWDAVPLARLLERAGVAAPIFIDNGASNLGRAESWFGAGRGSRHAIVALVGSGVGASIITDGSLYRGATSSAGEWGHTPVVVGGRQCRCGARGCLEAYIGAEGVLARYKEANPRRKVGVDSEEVELAALVRRSHTDPAARAILDDTALYMGAGIAGLINLFNPERIIIGGWAGILLGTELMTEIRASAAAHALREPFAQTAIELCMLGDDAVALGAATLPIEQLLSGELA